MFIEKKNVKIFIITSNNDFNEVAAMAILGMKHLYPDISLYLYTNQDNIAPPPGFDGVCHTKDIRGVNYIIELSRFIKRAEKREKR